MTLTEAQLQVRATGFGGTDMVAVCGESQYRSAIDVWLEKRHGLGLEIPCAPPEPFDGNERTVFGNVLEPVIAGQYASDTGMTLVEPTTTFRHPDRYWQLGTPDRLCYDADEVLPGMLKVLDAEMGDLRGIRQPNKIWEGKTHGVFGGKAYDLKHMEVPDDKRLQVAWYMSLTGCKQADLSALFDTHLYRVFHIPHDQEVEDYMLEEAEIFWRKVIEGVEPDPDGSKGFNDYLAKRFKLHTADMEECPVSLYEQIADYKAAREHKKLAEARMEVCKQEIKAAIGPSAGLLATNGKPTVTWKRKQVGSIAWRNIAEKMRDELGWTDGEFETLVAEFTSDPARMFLIK